MKELVWSVATFGCEAWTLKKDDERRIQAFEDKCIRKLPRIPWTRLTTNKHVYEMAQIESEQVSYGVNVKSSKLRHYRHVMRLPYDSTVMR